MAVLSLQNGINKRSRNDLRGATEKISILFEELIWKKLYPEQRLLIVVDNKGASYTGVGMNACTRDLTRFGLMLSKKAILKEK